MPTTELPSTAIMFSSQYNVIETFEQMVLQMNDQYNRRAVSVAEVFQTLGKRVSNSQEENERNSCIETVLLRKGQIRDTRPIAKQGETPFLTRDVMLYKKEGPNIHAKVLLDAPLPFFARSLEKDNDGYSVPILESTKYDMCHTPELTLRELELYSGREFTRENILRNPILTVLCRDFATLKELADRYPRYPDGIAKGLDLQVCMQAPIGLDARYWALPFSFQYDGNKLFTQNRLQHPTETVGILKP
jgi:hypothetical protein